MFASVARTVAHSVRQPGARQLSTTAAVSRQFFVGGNWKCNGTTSEVKVRIGGRSHVRMLGGRAPRVPPSCVGCATPDVSLRPVPTL